MNEPKKKGLPTWAIVLIVVAVGGPFVLGVFSALAIYGVRKYMVSAKRAEATNVLGVWSKGMLACAEKDGLPLSSPAVPASLSSVAARKYQSVASEWSDPAFVCAGFSMADPQFFQYQWQQESPAAGNLVALADFDGDGTAEQRLEVRITCAGGRCAASAPPAAAP
jgi:tRNA-binding EMAP/Myf-like protein